MKQFLFWLVIGLPIVAWAEGERVDIAGFSRGELNGWPTKVFAGEPRYALENPNGRLALRADYRRAFGEEPGCVDAVAIMTDTDNTGAVTTAWYGDIWFTEK